MLSILFSYPWSQQYCFKLMLNWFLRRGLAVYHLLPMRNHFEKGDILLRVFFKYLLPSTIISSFLLQERDCLNHVCTYTFIKFYVTLINWWFFYFGDLYATTKCICNYTERYFWTFIQITYICTTLTCFDFYSNSHFKNNTYGNLPNRIQLRYRYFT